MMHVPCLMNSALHFSNTNTITLSYSMAPSPAQWAGLYIAIPGRLTDTAINLAVMGDLKSLHLDDKG